MFARVSVKERPAIAPVDLEDLRGWLRIDDSDEDAVITACLSAAIAAIDGPEGVGVALMSQKWSLSLDSFPQEIRLPGWPVRSVSEVRYLTDSGEWEVVPPSAYRLTRGEPWRVVLRAGSGWPSVFGAGAVEVDYILGANDAAEVAPDLVMALRLLAAHYFENREAVVLGSTALALPLGVEGLIAPHRRGLVA